MIEMLLARRSAPGEIAVLGKSLTKHGFMSDDRATYGAKAAADGWDRMKVRSARVVDAISAALRPTLPKE